MPLTLVPEVDRVLRTATEWQFNAFKLAESTNQAPLSTLCFWVLQTQGLIREFGEAPPCRHCTALPVHKPACNSCMGPALPQPKAASCRPP